VESNLRAAGAEHTAFVFVGLLRRHLRELRWIERDALAFGRIDANGPFRLVEPGVTSGHEKPVLPPAGRSASFRDHDIARAILPAIDDETIQSANWPILEVENVDRGKGTAEPSVEVSRAYVNETAVRRALVASLSGHCPHQPLRVIFFSSSTECFPPPAL
jgi:hypothetical protein